MKSASTRLVSENHLKWGCANLESLTQATYTHFIMNTLIDGFNSFSIIPPDRLEMLIKWIKELIFFLLVVLPFFSFKLALTPSAFLCNKKVKQRPGLSSACTGQTACMITSAGTWRLFVPWGLSCNFPSVLSLFLCRKWLSLGKSVESLVHFWCSARVKEILMTYGKNSEYGGKNPQTYSPG